MKEFKIPSIPPTRTKSIRMPIDLIDSVEKAIVDQNCTFTAFVVAAVKMAVESLDEANKNEKNSRK